MQLAEKTGGGKKGCREKEKSVDYHCQTNETGWKCIRGRKEKCMQTTVDGGVWWGVKVV